MFCALRKKKRGPASLLCGMCVRVFSFIARCTLHVSFASGVGVRAASYGVVLPRKQESVLQDVIVGLNPVRNWCVAFFHMHLCHSNYGERRRAQCAVRVLQVQVLQPQFQLAWLSSE